VQLGQEYQIVIPALPGAVAKAAKAANAAKAVKKVAPTMGLTGYMPYILAGAGALVLIMLFKRN